MLAYTFEALFNKDITMNYTLTDIQCIHLPVDTQKFTEDQIQDIAMAFIFSQLSIFQEFGINGSVNPIGPLGDLLFSVEIQKQLSPQEYLEHTQLFSVNDPTGEFEKGLNRYMAQ